ncbi:hypothetical protein OsccyDRAFT_3071 [Leptolyngbyaceae cyanobacterium JSC-12]|nr:hypothetical protein OsccyDRAFT_3071 [Leptolyngbyaceae cyanobacterium JSC-12]
MALYSLNKEWTVFLSLGALLLPLTSVSALYEKLFRNLSIFSITAEQTEISTFNTNSASGYEPPPDIGKPRRTGGSGGRIS